MSRHSTLARYQGHEVIVVAGYDRPLDEVFLQVFHTSAEDGFSEECPIYCSIDEPLLDWCDVSTIAGKLLILRIDIPASLLDEVHRDQVQRVGNRIVRHHGPIQLEARPAISMID